MSDRIALVTGANKGIGLEVARELARKGFTVYLGSRDEALGSAAAKQLAGDGDVRAIRLDTTDEATMRAAVARLEVEQSALDVLVNNAGIAPDPAGPLEAERSFIDLCFETNVHGPARLIQLAAPLLRKAPSARIVNVASEAGSFAYLTSGPEYTIPYSYSMSKASMNVMTVLFANAFRAEGIKVNAVSPGLVNTDLSHHMGTRTPADAAGAVVRYALLGEDGPTGGFFNEGGPVAW